MRKSVGAEDTFAQDVHGYEPALKGVGPLVQKVWRYCDANGISGKAITLKVKYSDFKQVTRSKTVNRGFETEAEIAEIVAHLLQPVFPANRGVRLLGVTLSSLFARTANCARGDQMELTL